MKSLMEVSGHSKLETIMKVYNHVDKERVRRDLEKAFETRNILREKYS